VDKHTLGLQVQYLNARAMDLLAPFYGAFTVGFDAPDLKEANAALDELRA
jgi:hypothetical protein